jgi:hypothetical protein
VDETAAPADTAPLLRLLVQLAGRQFAPPPAAPVRAGKGMAR